MAGSAMVLSVVSFTLHHRLPGQAVRKPVLQVRTLRVQQLPRDVARERRGWTRRVPFQAQLDAVAGWGLKTTPAPLPSGSPVELRCLPQRDEERVVFNTLV